jgi:hypothetical protein
MFGRQKRKKWWSEFVVLGVFAAVVIAGLLYALVIVVVVGKDGAVETDIALPPVPPTAEEYRSGARDVLVPFLDQADLMTEADVASAGPVVDDFVEKTQERLLRLRVPKEYRDAHLTFVLLLDQWRRALAGSEPDRAVVLAKTRAVVETYPWVR